MGRGRGHPGVLSMAFLSGRVSFVRFQVSGERPGSFAEEHIKAIERNALGRCGTGPSGDGVSVGWSGGEHLLDGRFELEKNVLDDALHWGVRIDAERIPVALLRAYTQIELDARAAASPHGRVNATMRSEAKEAARVRAEAESADGRFTRRGFSPVLWDGRTNVLYVGATSNAVIERVIPLFQATFDRVLEPITAGSVALRHASEWTEREIPPALFHGEDGEDGLNVTVWSSEPGRPDWLGNEWLVWLWHSLHARAGTIALGGGSDVNVCLAKTLTLDCPRGEKGRDSLSDSGPTRLPEALRALQSGKLPRKAGMILERQGEQYEFVIQAERLAVTGLALPRIKGVSGRELRLARIESLRHFSDTLDRLIGAFGARRLGDDWLSDLSSIRTWLRAA